MRQYNQDLETLGVKVAVVTFEIQPNAQSYARDFGLKWPLLVDESRTLYAAYGMEQGDVWHVYGPAAWWAYAKLLSRGRRPRRPQGDTRQLGGDVLIDREGVVRLHHVGSGPADRPTVSSILDVIRRADKVD